MTVKVIDTSVVIDSLRGREEAVQLLDRLLSGPDPVVASELVRYEVLSGARASETEQIERFFSVLTWMDVSSEVSSSAAELYRRFRASHSGIDDIDYLIAATVTVLEADLLTTNVRHYPMLEGLEPAY